MSELNDAQKTVLAIFVECERGNRVNPNEEQIAAFHALNESQFTEVLAELNRVKESIRIEEAEKFSAWLDSCRKLTGAQILVKYGPHYCRHGVFVGDPYGADYMCGYCENGD